MTQLSPGAERLMPKLATTQRDGEAFAIDHRNGRLRFTGELRMADAANVWRRLRALTKEPAGRSLDIDLTDVSLVDGAVMALLVELRTELTARAIECEIVGASDRLAQLVHLYRGDEPARAPAHHPRIGLLEHVGGSTENVGRTFQRFVASGPSSHLKESRA